MKPFALKAAVVFGIALYLAPLALLISPDDTAAGRPHSTVPAPTAASAAADKTPSPNAQMSGTLQPVFLAATK